jgi:hypothetical protein
MAAKERARREEENERSDQAEHNENHREGVSLRLRSAEAPCNADHHEQAKQGAKRWQEISLHGIFRFSIWLVVRRPLEADSSCRTDAFLLDSNV